MSTAKELREIIATLREVRGDLDFDSLDHWATKLADKASEVADLIEAARDVEVDEAWWQNHVRKLTEKHERQIDHNESFYAVRIQAISDLAKQHGIWDEVAAILANGKVSPEDPPTYNLLLAREKARADKAEANYRWMVERAADQRLDGYRELGAKCAALEAERDELRATLREYVEEDDVSEGGEWEEANAHWLRIKRRAMTLLGMGGHRD